MEQDHGADPRKDNAGELTPSRRRFSYIPALLCFPIGVLAAIVARSAILLYYVPFEELLNLRPELAKVLATKGIPGSIAALSLAAGAAAAVLLGACFVGLARKGWTLSVVRKGYLASYLLFVYYAHVLFGASGIVCASEVEIDGAKLSVVELFYLRCDFLWPAAAAMVLVVFLHVLSLRRATINLYTGGDDDTPAVGDRIIENIRSHGRDPSYRKSTIGSVWVHLLVIIIIPGLLRLYGCVEPYRVPLGSGKPRIAIVKFVQKKKKKKRRKYILRPDSSIYFNLPDLEDSPVLKAVMEITELTYKANPSAAHGAMGTGGGDTPGWADGMKGGKVRFIRLEYRGQDWDDGMDSISRADLNFLDEFRKLSGLPVSRRTESHPVRNLRKYPKGMAPPFVYMTGSHGISIKKNDAKILREYLLGGGMLFADAGSGEWGRNFRTFVARQLFPGSPMRVIADDDPIFQMPFTFPHGAPPLWHHDGSQALGVKHKGRWVVFYHPGDMNDAWKTGHSGLSSDLAEGSFQLGTNIVYYAFTNYLRETKKYRK